MGAQMLGQRGEDADALDPATDELKDMEIPQFQTNESQATPMGETDHQPMEPVEVQQRTDVGMEADNGVDGNDGM